MKVKIVPGEIISGCNIFPELQLAHKPWDLNSFIRSSDSGEKKRRNKIMFQETEWETLSFKSLHVCLLLQMQATDLQPSYDIDKQGPKSVVVEPMYTVELYLQNIELWYNYFNLSRSFRYALSAKLYLSCLAFG